MDRVRGIVRSATTAFPRSCYAPHHRRLSNRPMILPRMLLLLIASLVVAGAPARAAEFYTEDLRIPMAEAGPQGLEAFLVRPAGTKRYPLALLSHGSPRSFDDRATDRKSVV